MPDARLILSICRTCRISADRKITVLSSIHYLYCDSIELHVYHVATWLSNIMCEATWDALCFITHSVGIQNMHPLLSSMSLISVFRISCKPSSGHSICFIVNSPHQYTAFNSRAINVIQPEIVIIRNTHCLSFSFKCFKPSSVQVAS